MMIVLSMQSPWPRATIQQYVVYSNHGVREHRRSDASGQFTVLYCIRRENTAREGEWERCKFCIFLVRGFAKSTNVVCTVLYNISKRQKYRYCKLQRAFVSKKTEAFCACTQNFPQLTGLHVMSEPITVFSVTPYCMILQAQYFMIEK